MKTEITPVSKMFTLVRREFQEQRILFLYMPVMFVFAMTIAYVANAFRSYATNLRFVGLIGNRVQEESRENVAVALAEFSEVSFEIKLRFWEIFYSQTLPLLYICFWAGMFYYFLMSLFSQRRDRSVLFWNSFPVNNAETIFSKLIAGLVLCHVIYIVSMFALQMLMLLIMLGYGAAFDMNLWNDFLAPSGILSRFGNLVLFSILSVVWCLPMYAWLMLTSAWAKSAPFAWAMAPIVMVVLLEMLFFNSTDSVRMFLKHTIPLDNWGRDVSESLGRLMGGEMLVSLVLGCALIFATIRFNRSEDL